MNDPRKSDFAKLYLDAYWVVRSVLETAEHSLQTPHPLWSELNELIEICDRMEKELEIENTLDSFRNALKT